MQHAKQYNFCGDNSISLFFLIPLKNLSVLTKKKIFLFSYILIILCSINVVLAESELAPGIISALDGPNVRVVENQVYIDIKSPEPHSAGLSHNRYTQFDVDRRGAILNNPESINAQIILNEVTGTKQSHLQGMLHVEGVRADVIVANPNGIYCDGCSFSNISQAILTTGVPNFESGLLMGFKIEKGKIVVSGNGLVAHGNATIDPMHIALLAKSVDIKSGIFAKDKNIRGFAPVGKLHIIAGRNNITLTRGTGSHRFIDEINMSHSKSAAQEDTSANQTEQIFIDVGSLGSMYAQKIFLTSTEQGIGVNSLGFIHAIEDLVIRADHIKNQEEGVLLSGHNPGHEMVIGRGDITINPVDTTSTESTFINKGKIEAGKNIGMAFAKFKNNIEEQALLFDFWANAPLLMPTIKAGDQLTIKTQSGENKGGILSAGEMLNLTSLDGTKSTGHFVNQAAVRHLYEHSYVQDGIKWRTYCFYDTCLKTKPADALLLSTQMIESSGGVMTAGRTIDIKVDQFPNKSTTAKPSLSGTKTIDEIALGGKIFADQKIDIDVNAFKNIGAEIRSGDILNITANDAENLSADIKGWKVYLKADDFIHKTVMTRHGTQAEYSDSVGKQALISGHHIHLDIKNDLNMAGAWIKASGDVRLHVEGKATLASLMRENKSIKETYDSKSKSGFFKDYGWQTTKLLEAIEQIHLNAGIDAEQALYFQGKPDVVFVGATLESGKKATIQSTHGHVYFKPLQLGSAIKNYTHTEEAWRTLFVPGSKESTTHDLSMHLKNINTEVVFSEGLDVFAPQGTVHIADADFMQIGTLSTGVPGTPTLTIKGKNIQANHLYSADQTQSNTTTHFFGIQYEMHSSVANAASNLFQKFEVRGSKSAYVRARILRGAQMAGDVTNLMFGDTLGGSVSFAFGKEDVTESNSHYNNGINQFYADHMLFEATEGDVNMSGAEMRSFNTDGKIAIKAKKKIFLSEAENKTRWDVDSKDKKFTIGGAASANVYMGAAGGGVRATYDSGTSNSTQQSTRFTPITLQANTLSFTSGEDMYLYGGKITGKEILLDIGRTLKIESAQETSNAYTNTHKWGGSFGVDANLYTLFGLNGDIHGEVGRTSQQDALTASQSGFVADKISGKIAHQLELVGAHMIANASTEKLVIGHKVQASMLIDNQKQDGWLVGGGVGVAVNGLPMGNIKYTSPVLKKFKSIQNATLAGDFWSAALATEGPLNTDAKKLMKMIVDDEVGTVEITGTFATLPRNAHPQKLNERKNISQNPVEKKASFALTENQITRYKLPKPMETDIAADASMPTQISNMHYIRIGDDHFPVIWDVNNATWRIFSPGYQYVRPQLPVKFADGKWQLHNDVGLLGGGNKVEYLNVADEDHEHLIVHQESDNDAAAWVEPKRTIGQRFTTWINRLTHRQNNYQEIENYPTGYRENMSSVQIDQMIHEGHWNSKQKSQLKKLSRVAKTRESFERKTNDVKSTSTLVAEHGRNVGWLPRLYPLMKSLDIPLTNEISTNQALVAAIAVAMSAPKVGSEKNKYFFPNMTLLARKLDEAVYPPDHTYKQRLNKMDKERYSDDHSHQGRLASQSSVSDQTQALTIESAQQKQFLKEGLLHLAQNQELIQNAYVQIDPALTTSQAINLLPENGSKLLSLRTAKHELLVGAIQSDDGSKVAQKFIISDAHFGTYIFSSKLEMGEALNKHLLNNRLAEEFYGANTNDHDKPVFAVADINPEWIRNISIGKGRVVNDLVTKDKLTPADTSSVFE